MEVHLFGGLRASCDGTEVDLGRPKQRFLFALLAMDAGRAVSTDRLTDLLWTDGDGSERRASLHAYIANLRRELEPGRERGAPAAVLVRQPPGYRLVLERGSVDALRFEDLVDVGRRHLAAGDESAALEAFDAAIGGWTGPPMPEFLHEPVVIEAITRWRGLLAVALEGAADLHLRAGAAESAARLLEPVLDEFPLRERLQALAALALYRTGRQTEALRVLERARRTLVEGAGLEPTAELRELERRILAHADEQHPTVRRGNLVVAELADPAP